MVRHKPIRTETRVEDAECGLVRAVVSTEAKDRDGDIIREAHWDPGERTPTWDELWTRILRAVLVEARSGSDQPTPESDDARPRTG